MKALLPLIVALLLAIASPGLEDSFEERLAEARGERVEAEKAAARARHAAKCPAAGTAYRRLVRTAARERDILEQLMVSLDDRLQMRFETADDLIEARLEEARRQRAKAEKWAGNARHAARCPAAGAAYRKLMRAGGRERYLMRQIIGDLKSRLRQQGDRESAY